MRESSEVLASRLRRRFGVTVQDKFGARRVRCSWVCGGLEPTSTLAVGSGRELE